MIPKIFHYCWFGGKPLPPQVLSYMESWRAHHPDFKLKQWDETNFDIDAMAYTREAYYARKYAFVSDVARLHALVSEGGVYLDTDILLKRAIPDDWMQWRFFAGFEHEVYVQTAIVASEPRHPLLERFYEAYQKRHFICGLRYDFSTNVHHFTKLLEAEGFRMDNSFQVLGGNALYPQHLLCGKDWKTGRYDTDETIAVHDFSGSWGDEALRHKYRHAARMAVTCLKWHLWGK